MVQIQTPQVVEEARAQFKIREGFDLDLLETIQPTYQVSSRRIASTAYPRTAMGRQARAAGGVGTNGQLEITGRADQGKIYLVDEVRIESVTATTYQLRIFDGAAIASTQTEATAKRYTDTRLFAQLPDALLTSSIPLTAAPDGRLIGTVIMAAAESRVIPLGIVLSDDTFFLIRNLTANEALECTWSWTEFLLEDR